MGTERVWGGAYGLVVILIGVVWGDRVLDGRGSRRLCAELGGGVAGELT